MKSDSWWVGAVSIIIFALSLYTVIALIALATREAQL